MEKKKAKTEKKKVKSSGGKKTKKSAAKKVKAPEKSMSKTIASKKSKAPVKSKPKTIAREKAKAPVRSKSKSIPLKKVKATSKRISKKITAKKTTPVKDQPATESFVQGEDLHLIPVTGEIHPIVPEEANRIENLFQNQETVALRQENQKIKNALPAKSLKGYRHRGQR